MTDVRINPYEGMFLFPQSGSANLAECAQQIKDILERAEADLIALRKWDERNLAYEIQKQKRGLYVLAYFRARSTQLANIERDCNLSENIMRFILTRCDHLTEDQMRTADDRDSLRAESKLREEDVETTEEAGEEPAMAGATTESEGDEEESNE